MDRISVIGIDLAKNVFQVHGVGERGQVVTRRKLSRKGLSQFMATLSPCLVGVEACGGARFWVREIKKHGHDVRMIPAQFVKPFVKSDKNDANDAEAICEAVQRPNMRFVADKTIAQQEIQLLHRTRSGLVANRTAVCNELRAMLSDYGITAAQKLSRLEEKVRGVLSSEGTEFSSVARELLQSMLRIWMYYDEQIENLEQMLEKVFKENEVCRRLATIPGVGKITATAVLGTVPNASAFKSGRHLSAWLGLVPRQNSSGGKSKLSGITKRGDTYLRMLLIHGGRSVVRTASGKADKRSLWVVEKMKTRGKNKAAVAVANKNARIIWKLLKSNEVYMTA